MRRLLSVALLVCLLPSVAVGRDWYVNNVAGDDRKDGLNPTSLSANSGPVRTIAKALRHAGKMDRIILANTGEPYRESISIGGQHGGIELAPFTIIGNGAILDGSAPVPTDGWEHFRGETFQFQPPRLSAAQQLFLDGRPLVKGPGPAADGRLPELQPLQWRYFDRHIQFRPEAGKLPHQYNLSMAVLPVGITIYQAVHVDIQDLTVQGFQLDGINAHDSVFASRLVGITARGNGRSGISIGGASQVLLEACLVGNNGHAQVRTEGWSHTLLVNCNLLENTAPALVKEDHSEVQVRDVE